MTKLNSQSGSLKNRFDAAAVQNELDLQRNVSQQFSQTVGTAQGMLNEKIDALKQQQEVGEITKADYAQKLKQLQHSQMFLNMVAAALSAPTDSAAGIAAATAAPAISYGIGQEFKKHNQEGSATHIASHMALGAVVSALGGNDAVSGALAAGGAEALVPLFSKAMYGTTDPEKLTAADKQNLSNMARLFGAAVGAATSNGAANGYADVAQGSLNAGTAVENNRLLRPTPRNMGRTTQNPNQPRYRNMPLQNPQLTQQQMNNMRRISQLESEIRELEPNFKGLPDHQLGNPGSSYVPYTNAQVVQYQNYLTLLQIRIPTNQDIINRIVPNGRYIGTKYSQRTDNSTRSVSVNEFNQIETFLLRGATKGGTYSNGMGQWYDLPSGGRVGVRQSSQHGRTLDINIPNLPTKGMKIHIISTP